MGAGVIIRKRMLEQVGWCDTAHEDVDISLKFYMSRYNSLYIDHVTTSTEATPSLLAYRTQQDRWTKGHTKAYRALRSRFWQLKNFPLWRNIELLVHYVFIRRTLKDLFFQGFVPICLLGPFSLVFPGIFPALSPWVYCYMPVVVAFATTSLTKNGWIGALPYLMLVNSMGLLRVRGVWLSFVEKHGASQSAEWVSTGDVSMKQRGQKGAVLWQELVLGTWMIVTGLYGLLEGGSQLGLASVVFVHGM